MKKTPGHGKPIPSSQFFKLTRFVVIFFLSFFISNCKKKIDIRSDVDQTEISHVSPPPIAPYLFNWETTTYMPSPVGGNQIQMPWNSGTTAIDPNIVSDYRSVDGWVMVWNTFSPTTTLNDPNYTYFFSLYNVYRGLLRFYLWQPASSIATSYVNHGLSLYTTGTTSSMLNFNAAEIVDPSVNKAAFTLMLNQSINSAGGTWFAFQYEIAYDANIVNTTFPNFGLTWASQWAGISSITLNGTQAGTIKGYLGNQSDGQIHFGSLLAQGLVTLFGSIDYAAFFVALNNNTALPYSSALNSALSGIVKGFFSGIFGGGTQGVNLTINTQINLTGSLVSNGGLENMKLVLPGQSNSQNADGNTPAYNNIMGVYNISNKPTVHAVVFGNSFFVEDPYGGGYEQSYTEASYTLDNNSFQLIWNPAIINNTPSGATIQNIKKEIVILNTLPFMDKFCCCCLPSFSSYSNSSYYGQYHFGSTELIGNINVLVADASSPDPLILDMFYEDPTHLTTAVRISFDVVPNNGAAPSKLVKTFLATVQ